MKASLIKRSYRTVFKDKPFIIFSVLVALIMSELVVQNQVLREQLYQQQASAPISKLNPYIVVLHDGSNPSSVASDMAKIHGLAVTHTYHAALKGFSAVIPEVALDKIKQDPQVKFVSEDKTLSINDVLAAKTGSGGKVKPTQTPTVDPCGLPGSSQVIPCGVKRIGQPATNKGSGEWVLR